MELRFQKVFVFTSDNSEKFNPSKIIAIIIMPKVYPENLKCLTIFKPLLRQKFPALKRLALCTMKFNVKFVNFTMGLKLDLLCLNDCYFDANYPIKKALKHQKADLDLRYAKILIESREAQFNAELL